jgi:hypothetical protein
MTKQPIAPAPGYADVVTPKQLTELYPFLNANTLRYLRHTSKGPASFTINGRVLYRLAEVERWLVAEEAASTRGGNDAA